MDTILEIFNNREIAIGIWGILVISILLFTKPAHEFLITSLPILFCKKFVVFYVVFISFLVAVMDALKKQGKRTDLTSDPVGPKLSSAEKISQDSEDSATQIKRYIRLTNLEKSLLNLVDEGRIAMRPAVELSYLTPKEQMMIFETYESDEVTPSLAQAQKMRKLSEQNQLNADTVLAILTAPKPNQAEAIKIPEERINKFFGKNYTKQQKEEHILKSLEYYHKYLQRQRNKDRDAR